MLLSDDGESKEVPMISGNGDDEENEQQLPKIEVEVAVEEKEEVTGKKPSFLIQQDD